LGGDARSCRGSRKTSRGRDRIQKTGLGERLVVTTGRRVWVNLYGHTSPGEFEMANTDVQKWTLQTT
jgi:hypothetical protein